MVNWGTNSCFIVIGKKYWKKDVDQYGNEDLHEVLPIGITLDERIADGFCYAAFLKYFRRLLQHPEVLDQVPAEINSDID